MPALVITNFRYKKQLLFSALSLAAVLLGTSILFKSNLVKSSRTLYKSAIQQYNTGKSVEAERLLSEALFYRYLVWPTNESNLLYGNISEFSGKVLYQNGKYQKALINAQNGLQLKSKYFGPAANEIFVSKNNLGCILSKLSKFDEAEKQLEDVYRARKKLSEKDPNRIAPLNNLGSLYMAWHKYERAQEKFQKSLDLSIRAYGKSDLRTNLFRDNLAMALLRQKKFQQAKHLLDKNLEICERNLGEESTITADTINNYASLLYEEGQYKNAEVLARRCLAIRKKFLGEEHLHTALAYNNLGAIYNALERFDKAEICLAKSFKIFSKVSDQKPHSASLSLKLLNQAYVGQSKKLDFSRF